MSRRVSRGLLRHVRSARRTSHVYRRLSSAISARPASSGSPACNMFRARMHGRIRSGPDARWMPFSAEQYNFFDDKPARLFYMTASMFGVPFQGFHRYVGRSASMRVKVAGMAPVVDASGADLTEGGNRHAAERHVHHGAGSADRLPNRMGGD